MDFDRYESNKGNVYSSSDLKNMMVITVKDFKYCDNCNSVNGMITLNFKDFSIFDVIECLADFLDDIVCSNERREEEVED